MQKRGTVKLAGDETYYVVWAEDSTGAERVDVVRKPMEFDIVDSTGAIAAYFKKTKELYFGRDEIIQAIWRIRSTAATHSKKTEQTFEVQPDGVYIKQFKIDENVGIEYRTILRNGLLVEQYFKTPEGEVLINDVVDTAMKVVEPINLGMYRQINVTNVVVGTYTGDAEYYPLSYLKAKYPLDHIEDNDFEVVMSMERAEARLQEWIDAPTKVKAIDTETTGTDVTLFGKDCITGVVLSYSTKDSTYYPFRQEKCEFNLPMSFLRKIISAVNGQPDDVKIVGYNAKFEKEAVTKEYYDYIKYSEYAVGFRGYDPEQQLRDGEDFLRIDADAYILSVMHEPVMRKGLHTLKKRVSEIEGKFYLELHQIFKKEIKFNVLTPDIIKYYACPDTPNTIKVYNALLDTLPKDEYNLFAKIESPLVDVKACNEFYGMRTDRGRLIGLIENGEYVVKTLREYVQGLHHTTANIDSPNVLSDIVYNKLRCPVIVRTKTGMPSTSKDAIKCIVEDGIKRDVSEEEKSKYKPIRDLNKKVVVKGEDLACNKYPSLVIYREYKKKYKELGALKRIDKHSARDRVYFGINQVGAGTSRQTSDAHQYSDEMKSIILSDSRYHNLWSADFKQIELRILAYLAGQKDLIELESNPDIDVHRAITALILKKEIWEITSEERQAKKRSNFGAVYGITEYGLVRQTHGLKFTKEELREARDSITDFYNRFHEIKKFTKANEECIRRNGYIKTEFGWYRYFKEVLDPNTTPKQIAAYVRRGNNTPVQGWGASWLKMVENNFNKYIKDKGWNKRVDCDGVMLPMVRLMLPIHDEVLISTHKSIPPEEIITMCKECMEMKVEGAPPFFSGPALVSNWADGKEDAYEIPIRFRDKVVEEWTTKGKRNLHCKTYDEGLDVQGEFDILDLTEKLREIYLTDADFVDGKLKVTEQTRNKFLAGVDAETLERLRRHTIPEYEKDLPEQQILKFIVDRTLDAKFYPYLDDLNHFRTKRLEEYMDDLFAKYHTNEEVAKHVRHEELTHVLISLYIKKDEAKEWSQIERISKAVERYAEAKNDLGVIAVESKDIGDDDELSEISSVEELCEYVYVDSQGEVVEDELDDYESCTNDDLSYLDEDVDSEDIPDAHTIYGLDEVIVDLTKFDMAVANEIHIKFSEISDESSPYRIVYLLKGVNRPVPSNLYVPYNSALLEQIINEVGGSVA